MIKPTFYNLPEEKKQRLFLAAKRELARVSFADASINKIIKDAGISRGSFYTYFDDKSDMVYCLLGEYFKVISKQLNLALERSQGDIFELFIELFDTTLAYTALKDDMVLFHNLFKTMHTNAEFQEQFLADEKLRDAHFQHIMDSVNRQNLRLTTDDELKDLLELLFAITRKSMAKAMSPDGSREAARHSFFFKLDIIKHGISKVT